MFPLDQAWVEHFDVNSMRETLCTSPTQRSACPGLVLPARAAAFVIREQSGDRVGLSPSSLPEGWAAPAIIA